MIITQENLDQLRVTFEMRFQEGYDSAQLWSEKAPFCTDIPSTTEENVYGWIAQQLRLRKWIGPRVAQNLSEHDYRIRNEPFEGTVEVDRDKIEDDNLGMFTSIMMPQLGEAVRKHRDVLLEELLLGNPTAFDGEPFYDTAHPTFAPSDLDQSYSNTTAIDLSPTALVNIMNEMAVIPGEDGRPMGIRPTHLVIPPQLEYTARQILNSSTFAAVSVHGDGVVQIENQLKGMLDIVVVPALADDADRFFLFDLSKAIKPFIYQKRREPQFVSRDRPDDPKVFDLKKFTYGVDYRAGKGVSLPFLAYRSTGAG